jgi:NAD(P)-dependent dehydrogenase (short-subunit alcohol dehydrogenase family)
MIKEKGRKMSKALIIGNSDGIGLGVTRVLLQKGWQVTGLSKSGSPVDDPNYRHQIVDVRQEIYVSILQKVVRGIDSLDLCIYCAGIGVLLDISQMQEDVKVFEVNLLGMVKSVSCVIPFMVEQGKGHFIGISSVADEMLSFDAPSYHASKAGFSNYLEGLALALKPMGVQVTNLRFGFVDTKMAKGDAKPFMMTIQDATDHVLKCVGKRPVRYTAPRGAIPLIKFRAWTLRMKAGYIF